MAKVLAGGGLTRTGSEMLNQADVFQSSGRQPEEDEKALKWAAIERLPTFDRMKKGMIKQLTKEGKMVHEEVDVTNLGTQDKKHLMESVLKVAEEDNEKFLRRLRERTDRLVPLCLVLMVEFLCLDAEKMEEKMGRLVWCLCFL